MENLCSEAIMRDCCIADIYDNFGHILCLSNLIDADNFKQYFWTSKSLQCSISKTWIKLLGTNNRTQFDKTTLTKLVY